MGHAGAGGADTGRAATTDQILAADVTPTVPRPSGFEATASAYASSCLASNDREFLARVDSQSVAQDIDL